MMSAREGLTVPIDVDRTTKRRSLTVSELRSTE